jgi:hypothetical protein
VRERDEELVRRLRLLAQQGVLEGYPRPTGGEAAES